jgi:AcrR family transcriptional regulator
MSPAGQARVVGSKGGALQRGADELSGKRSRTRKRILEATFQLIGHERGLNTRIEEICAAAGVSRGTFYNYFASTEALYQTLAVELSHGFNLAVVATLETIESNAVRTNAAIQHYLKRARRDRAWGWAMVHLSAAGPFFGAESYEACYLTVERGINSGEFDVPHPQYGRDLLLGTILSAMVTTLREGGTRTQPRVIAQHLLRALGVPDRKAREIAASPLPDIVAVP